MTARTSPKAPPGARFKSSKPKSKAKPPKSRAKAKSKLLKAKSKKKTTSTRIDWDSKVEGLTPGVERRFELSSAGVAQVTRVRLLEVWDGLEAHTKGNVLFLTKS